MSVGSRRGHPLLLQSASVDQSHHTNSLGNLSQSRIPSSILGFGSWPLLTGVRGLRWLYLLSSARAAHVAEPTRWLNSREGVWKEPICAQVRGRTAVTRGTKRFYLHPPPRLTLSHIPLHSPTALLAFRRYDHIFFISEQDDIINTLQYQLQL